MQVGFVGLGKMGGNMVHRIRRDSEHEVVAFDFNADAVKAAEDNGAAGADSLKSLVSQLSAPRHIWVMVPAGDPTQSTIEALLDMLEAGDTIIDGGNSKWKDSVARFAQCAARDISFIDVGTSGGVWGLEVGYCMMVGGDADAVERFSPILDVLAPPNGWGRMGGPGSGHYVKMIHNGIEYGMMQAYAEGFELLHKSEYALDVKQIAEVWGQGSVVRSWLLELAVLAFDADGNDLSELEGYVNDSGEGRWTLESAVDHDVPMPVLAAAIFSRFTSRGNGDYTARMLAALRNQFGGHAVNKASGA